MGALVTTMAVLLSLSQLAFATPIVPGINWKCSGRADMGTYSIPIDGFGVDEKAAETNFHENCKIQTGRSCKVSDSCERIKQEQE